MAVWSTIYSPYIIFDIILLAFFPRCRCFINSFSLSPLSDWLSPLVILCSVSSLIFISGFFHGFFLGPLEENNKPNNTQALARLSDSESSDTFASKRCAFCPFFPFFFFLTSWLSNKNDGAYMIQLLFHRDDHIPTQLIPRLCEGNSSTSFLPGRGGLLLIRWC